MSYWVHIVTHAYIRFILLYMFALALIIFYQYETFVNIDTIDLNILFSDLNCTSLFSNRCISRNLFQQLQYF